MKGKKRGSSWKVSKESYTKKNLLTMVLILIIILGFLGIYSYYSNQQEVGKRLIQQVTSEKEGDFMSSNPSIIQSSDNDFFKRATYFPEPIMAADKGNGPHLLLPANKALVNENDCKHYMDGLTFKWEQFAGAGSYILKIRLADGRVFGERVAGTEYYIPKTECENIPEGEYEWWIVPLIGGDEGPISESRRLIFEKFTTDYAQVEFNLKSVSCDGNEDVGIILPNVNVGGSIEWGYMAIHSDSSMYSSVGDYQMIEESKTPVNDWVLLNGDISLGEKIKVQVLYDPKDPSSTDKSMINTFENSVNVIMPKSADKWPVELQKYLKNSEGTIDRDWIMENYKHDGGHGNLVARLGEYIKNNDINIKQVIESAEYIAKGRKGSYDSEKVDDAFDRNGKTTDDYVSYIRSAKEVYLDRKGVCNSNARYVCAIFRAIGFPCMTKTSASMHADPAVWVPYSNKEGRYTMDDGEWVFLVGEFTPYSTSGLLKTFSFGSSEQDYFNLLWHPKCLMNLKYETSVDDFLKKDGKLKLIFVKPGWRNALNPNFLKEVKEKGDAFFLHHLIPLPARERMYVWKSREDPDVYRLDIIDQNLDRVGTYTLDFRKGDWNNKEVIRPRYKINYNAKRYKDYIIFEIISVT